MKWHLTCEIERQLYMSLQESALDRTLNIRKICGVNDFMVLTMTLAIKDWGPKQQRMSMNWIKKHCRENH